MLNFGYFGCFEKEVSHLVGQFGQSVGQLFANL